MTPASNPGERFAYQSVVDHYHLRPDYPPEIYSKLFEFVRADSAVLDIGCGPGKISYPASKLALRVDAVDPSAAMIDAARSVPQDDSNINWIVGKIETVGLSGPYSLAVAGSSIHWVDLDVFLPRLTSLLDATGKVVFLNGDAAIDHPWRAAELALMKNVQIAANEERPLWVDTVKYPPDPVTSIVDHELFEREGFEIMRQQVRSSIDDYIGMFFSRQSFALDCMPDQTAGRFRVEMLALLEDYTVDGVLTYTSETAIEWGRPRLVTT